MSRKKNPGPFRKQTQHPSKKYLDEVKRVHDAINRTGNFGRGTELDTGRWGTWGKGGYNYNHTVLPFYHAGLTPNEAAHAILIERAGTDPIHQAKKWHTFPPDIPIMDADAADNLARAVREVWSEPDLKRRTSSNLKARYADANARDAARAAERKAAEAIQEELRVARSKTYGFLDAVEKQRVAEARRERTDAARAAYGHMRTVIDPEVSRSDPFRDADDRESARRRASTLEINPRRRRWARRPSRRQLRLGLREEREHDDVTGGDPRLVRRIALAHLREHPRYYTELARCFRKNGARPRRLRCRR